MRAQLAKAGTPGPKAIGIDEISQPMRHRPKATIRCSERLTD